MVISDYPWHLHLLPSLFQWSCHYLFLWLGSVAAGNRTPNLPLAGPTLSPTAPPPRCLELNLIKIFTEYHVRFFIYNPDHEYPTFEIILMRSQLSVIFRNFAYTTIPIFQPFKMKQSLQVYSDSPIIMSCIWSSCIQNILRYTLFYWQEIKQKEFKNNTKIVYANCESTTSAICKLFFLCINPIWSC